MKYVIWGSGLRGKRLFPHIKESVVAFIDSDEKKIGQNLFDKPIISYEEYKDNYRNYWIVISYSYESEIIEILNKDNIYNYFLMSDCPGEFQEHWSRDNLKDYIKSTLSSNKRYAVYGTNLYSFVLSGWGKEKLNNYIPIILSSKTSKKIIDSLKNTFPDIQLYSLEEFDFSTIDEVLDTTDSLLKNNNEFIEGDTVYVRSVYDCSSEIEKYRNPLIKKFKNLHKGEDCFIVGCGPSLRMEDLDVLSKNNIITFSMNRIYYAFEKTSWRPDYYVISDYRFFEEDTDVIENIPVDTKFYGDATPEYWSMPHDESIYKFHIHWEYKYTDTYKISGDCSQSVYFGPTVAYIILQFAFYMGFKNIYLLGIDNGSSKKDGSVEHFCNNYTERTRQMYSTYYDEANFCYKAAKDYAEAHGINIFNATRGGQLEVFPRVNFDTLFN